MNKPRIIAVHPIDGNLGFLKKLIRKLFSNSLGSVIYLRLSNNRASHDRAINNLSHAGKQDLICLFCHGRSNGLLGCSYKAFHPDDSMGRFVYIEKYGNFLDISHAEILANKKIFCLSCDSVLWGKRIVDAGVAVFLGFTNINFDIKIFLENNVQRKAVERLVKYKLREAIFFSIQKSKEKEFNFYQFKSLLKIALTKAADNLILNFKGQKGQKFYFAAAECLQEINDGIKLFGNGNLKL